MRLLRTIFAALPPAVLRRWSPKVSSMVAPARRTSSVRGRRDAAPHHRPARHRHGRALVVFAHRTAPGLKPVAAAASLAPAEPRRHGMKKPSDSATPAWWCRRRPGRRRAPSVSRAATTMRPNSGGDCALEYDASVAQVRFLGPTGGEVKRLMLSSGFGGFAKEQAATLAGPRSCPSWWLMPRPLTLRRATHPWPTARGELRRPSGRDHLRHRRDPPAGVRLEGTHGPPCRAALQTRPR